MVENSLRESLSGNMQLSVSAIAEAITEENGEIVVNESSLKKNFVKLGVYIQVYNQNGDALYCSRDAEWIFKMAENEKDTEKEWFYLTQSKTINGHTAKIQILGNIYFNDFLNDFLWTLLLIVPCYILLAAIGSMFLANRALQPIRRITETAKKSVREIYPRELMESYHMTR